MQHLIDKLGGEISIHAPRTGSDGAPYITNGRAFSISIHAPRTGSDAGKLRYIGIRAIISIHAPRTGSDSNDMWRNAVHDNFNPRSPHGERLKYSRFFRP